MKKLLDYIQNIYGLKIVASERVLEGFLSENYFLSNNETKFFLKKYRFNNSQRIAEIHLVKKYFSDGGIPVILPIQTRDNQTFFEYMGAFYALFPFVDGTHVDINKNRLTDAMVVSLGKMLGRIHLLGKEAKIQVNDYFKIETEDKVREKIENLFFEIRKQKTTTEFDRVALQSITLKKKLLDENISMRDTLSIASDHLIHGDYLAHNVFFDKNDAVEYVFDFEKTGYAPRIFELFRSMFYSISLSRPTNAELKSFKTYINAYSSVYPISKDEIIQGLKIYFLKSIHGFWVESEHYLKGNTRVDHFLFPDYQRISYLSENMHILINILTT